MGHDNPLARQKSSSNKFWNIKLLIFIRWNEIILLEFSRLLKILLWNVPIIRKFSLKILQHYVAVCSRMLRSSIIWRSCWQILKKSWMEKCCFKANVVFFISHLYRKKWKNMVYFFHRVTTKILTKRTNVLLKFVGHVHQNYLSFQDFNRYRRKRPKVDASIFDSALSHSRRSEASE